VIKNRLLTYRLEISEENGKPIIEREILRYKRGAYGSPFHFIDFSRGVGYAITNEEDFDKPDEEGFEKFVEILQKNRVNVRVRHSRGKDIDAACGQLANKDNF
jgi:predicted ATPase